MQIQAKALIQGVKQEIYSREHPQSKKPLSDSSKPKISRIVVYFSDKTGNEDMFAGPVVDTYLQCTKSEVGFIIPLAYKEHIVPLLLSIPWSYWEFIELNKQLKGDIG